MYKFNSSGSKSTEMSKTVNNLIPEYDRFKYLGSVWKKKKMDILDWI